MHKINIQNVISFDCGISDSLILTTNGLYKLINNEFTNYSKKYVKGGYTYAHKLYSEPPQFCSPPYFPGKQEWGQAKLSSE